ncbi:hypothetical protein [Rhizobium binxianense]
MDMVKWQAPHTISRAELVSASERLLARPSMPIVETEDIFRIEALDLEWDIGVMSYSPSDRSRIPTGIDGRRIGFFLLHGGAADFRFMAPLARLLAGKYGYHVASMTYPGRLNLNDASRDWPGDTIAPDGSVRLPVWLTGEDISQDQVEVVRDQTLRARYGTRTSARAGPGTRFYDRMAAWPVAFELGMKTACSRQFPQDQYSVYVHGHSTGGPFAHMLTQRVDNIVGVVGMENSPFGYIYQRMLDIEWPVPFNDLYIRTWRDIARYSGAEIYHQEGGQALMRLPWLIEDVFAKWERGKTQPNFKAEYPIHYASVPALTAAAHAAAARLKLGEAATDELVARYIGYTRELSGPKPVPPILLSIAKFSRDHRPEIYESVVLPSFADIRPAPRVELSRFDAGTHAYERAEDGLPFGLVPAMVELWKEAIEAGYFMPRPL